MGRGVEAQGLAPLRLEVWQHREADLAGGLGRLRGVEEGRRCRVPLEGRRGFAGLKGGQHVRVLVAEHALGHELVFLQQVEEWIPKDVERVYAVLDNLSMHRAMDVLFFNLAYPRWEFVFQPTYAAYLNLIEPWWKTLKSLALNGRRFETWREIEEAVRSATAYWNAHKHPYVWGRRRRHQPRRKPGIARLPQVA